MGDIISAIGAAGGGPFNALIGGKAAVTAGEQQQAGIGAAENTVRDTYNQNSPYYQPFIQNGTAANNQATQMAQNGFTQTQFQQSPAYQFNMQQGLQAISNAQSVRGGALSGGAMKAMNNYGQQQASNEFQNAYGRYANNINQLNQIGNQGLQATQGLGQLGANYSSAMGNLQTGMGNSQASETLGKAGAFMNLFNPSGQTAAGTPASTSMGSLVSSLGSMFSSTPSNNPNSYAGYDAGAAQNEQGALANSSDAGSGALANSSDEGLGALGNAMTFA